MEHKFTAEQIEAARAANSPEELMEKAKAQGIELTLEQATEFLHAPEGELSDAELENAAGGGCGGGGPSERPDWKAAAAAQGHTVLVPSATCFCVTVTYSGPFGSHTEKKSTASMPGKSAM